MSLAEATIEARDALGSVRYTADIGGDTEYVATALASLLVDPPQPLEPGDTITVDLQCDVPAGHVLDGVLLD